VIAMRAGVVALAALALAGCSSGGTPPSGAAGVGAPGLINATRVEVFTCADWNRVDLQTQLATVAAIRDFVGGQVTGAAQASGTGTVLDDEQAFEFFDQYCEQELARHFLLYKLYGRAAGFAGQAP
jgi:hypothetical protein